MEATCSKGQEEKDEGNQRQFLKETEDEKTSSSKKRKTPLLWWVSWCQGQSSHSLMLDVTEQRLQLRGKDAEMTLISKPRFFAT